MRIYGIRKLLTAVSRHLSTFLEKYPDINMNAGIWKKYMKT
jgi:hypothetical protein